MGTRSTENLNAFSADLEELLADVCSPQQLEMERQAFDLEQQAFHEELLMRFVPGQTLKRLHGGMAFSLREEAEMMRLEWYSRPHLIH